MLIRLLVCASMAAARLGELAYSRRNLARSVEAREGRGSRATYPLIVALHTFVIAGTLLRGSSRPSRPWLMLLLAVQPLRLWVLLRLGARWNARGAVPASLAVETRGPYVFIRHPNYLVVTIELLALPLAFRLPSVAALAAPVNAALLAVRIRDEEAALMRVPAYRHHFGSKARFIPGVF